jgi:glycosyltransferase involved in cell wall biosynthesis
MDGLNPRKNLTGLLAAFSLLRRKTSRPVRLVVKQYRAALPLEEYPDVINIPDMLDDGRMAALYALSDAYVSPHRAEGWGLSLSSAMALGKTVIATGYSGNLEFMNPKNSLLLPYQLVHITQEAAAAFPLFRQEMRWAEPDLPAMVQAMLLVAEKKVPTGLNQEAALIAEHFGQERICRRLKELLEKM